MKKRVISTIVMVAILVPILLWGGYPFTFLLMFIAGLSLNELFNIKATKKNIPTPIKILGFIMLSLFILFCSLKSSLILSLDFRYLAAFGVVFLLPLIIYQEQKTYTINDASFVVFWVLFLGTFFGLFAIMRNIRLAVIIYLVNVAFANDTFAHMGGSLIGKGVNKSKNKIMAHVSPNKTLEGAIYGSFMATVIGMAFYMVVVDQSAPLYLVGGMTFLLTICGILGDLIFSSVKRYYKKKDYSSLIPGHGGVLDRIDGLIFVGLVYVIVVTTLF